jgi:hypothetical protein
MITKEMVDRINWLARKQRTTGLSEEEKKEQHGLRQQYLQCIRSQVVDALDPASRKPPKTHQDKCACQACNGGKKVH